MIVWNLSTGHYENKLFQFRMSCLMLDDINDHSETRRGVPCWYRVKNAGFTNINDALILENDAYFLLRKYFEDHPCYVSLLNLCHETISISYKGQVLDQLSSCLHQKNLQNFTMDRYRSIVTNKSGYFSFYFPVAVAMNLAGIYNAQLYRKVASVLLQMGHFVQIKVCTEMYLIHTVSSIYLVIECYRMITWTVSMIWIQAVQHCTVIYVKVNVHGQR